MSDVNALLITVIILSIISFIGFLGTATSGEFGRAILLLVFTAI